MHATFLLISKTILEGGITDFISEEDTLGDQAGYLDTGAESVSGVVCLDSTPGVGSAHGATHVLTEAVKIGG